MDVFGIPSRRLVDLHGRVRYSYRRKLASPLTTRRSRLVQKKGKDRKPLLNSTSLVFLFLLLLPSVFLIFGRESAVKTVSYGELMQMLQADDPELRFQNVVVRRNTEIRGEMVVTE